MSHTLLRARVKALGFELQKLQAAEVRAVLIKETGQVRTLSMKFTQLEKAEIALERLIELQRDRLRALG